MAPDPPGATAALRHIGNRSKAIDVYIWPSYRLHSLHKATPIGWSTLHAQFDPARLPGGCATASLRSGAGA